MTTAMRIIQTSVHYYTAFINDEQMLVDIHQYLLYTIVNNEGGHYV